MNKNDIVFVKYGTNDNGLGGEPTSTIIAANTLNNLGFKILREATQKKYLRCVGIKNNHATETIKNLFSWLNSTEGVPPGIKVEFGYEINPNKYDYTPYGVFDGIDDFVSVPDSASLDLNHHSVCCWFKTSTTHASETPMVNKGGFISETTGSNLNYGLWINSTNKIKGGFEDSAGVDYYVTSPNAYADGVWHFACVTYDGTTLKLYIDGNTTPVATLATTATPETNAQPLVLGRNSNASNRFFNGCIDEVKIFDTAITASEQNEIYNTNIYEGNASHIVYENKFGADDGKQVAQIIANENTDPTGVTFYLPVTKPADDFSLGDFKPGRIRALWIRLTVDPNIRDVSNAKIHFGVFGTIPTTAVGGGESPSLTTVAVFGDSDINSATRDNTIPQINTMNPDLVIGVGDHNYKDSGSASEYESTYSSILSKWKFTKGNHDDDNSSKKSFFRSHHGITDSSSRYWYSFNHQNIHFLVMSSEDSFSIGSDQNTFVNADLQDAKNDGAIKWIVAIIHRPWFSSTSKHPQNEGDIVEKYMSIFISAGVNLILTGHNHNYQRTHPLRYNSSDPDNPITEQTGTDTYTKGSWLIHIIEGRGGHDVGSSLYDLDSNPSWLKVKDRTKNGITKIFTTNNGLTLNIQALDWDNEIMDSFTIT